MIPLLLAAAPAVGQESSLVVGPSLPPAPAGVLRELDHPRYVDESGRLYDWGEVRSIADPEALGRVRRRQVGRSVLKVVFAGAAAVEVWGTWQLARRDSVLAVPLGIQAAATGLAEVLLFARGPSDVRRDHALVVNSVNGWR